MQNKDSIGATKSQENKVNVATTQPIHHKRSERLRIKSARGGEPYSYLGDEFVYDYNFEEHKDDNTFSSSVKKHTGSLQSTVESVNVGEVTSGTNKETGTVVRPRSSSWSNVKKSVAVVERRLRKAVTPKATKKSSNRIQDKVDPKPSEDFAKCQRGLSQRRIDLLFQRKSLTTAYNNTDSEEETEVYLKGEVVDTSAIDKFLLSELQGSDTAAKTIVTDGALSAPQGATSTHYLYQYNSDFESVTSEANKSKESSPPSLQAISALSSVVQTGNSVTLQKESKMGEGAPATVEDMKRLLDNMKESLRIELKSDMENMTTANNVKVNEDIKNATTKTESLERELNNTKTELKLCQIQLKEVIGVSVRQDQEIKECKSQMEFIAKRIDKNVLRITGLVERKAENCAQVAKTFIQEKLQITKDFEILDAHRIGTGNNRVMLVYLQSAIDRNDIMSNTAKLKDLMNEENNPYYISRQLSAGMKAKKQRHKALLSMNKELDTQYQRDMKIENGELKVDGITYQKKLVAPSCREILLASKQQRLERLSKDVTKGIPKKFRGQEFLAYTAPVKDTNEANIAYAKIRSLHTDARHVISACRTPGKDFHTCQDFVDDAEHGGGQFLLNILLDSAIQNRVIMVVRNYEGDHIGNKRFELMREAVRSALDRSPKNNITGKHDCMWNFEKDTAPNDIRGRGRGRGRGGLGRGLGRGQWKSSRAASLLQGMDPEPLLGMEHSYAEAVGLNIPKTSLQNEAWVEKANEELNNVVPH